jgi:two-component system sensor histidine kinase BaeS
VQLVDRAGLRIAGNPHIGADAAEVPVMLDGRVIGTLRLAPLPALIGTLDRDFAATQWHDALGVGVLVLLGALAFAFTLARWLLGPVRALAAATRALAAGDYRQRVTVARGDELGALARDFNHLAETLEQNRDARRQWGADIAHELRTPLAILRGEIDALRDGVRPLGAAALVSLQAECQRLSTLVEDLYQLSLADAGALEYRFEAVDLRDLVRESVALQRAAFADAGLALDADCPAVPPVHGDARRLDQLLDNLLANARRYTDAPGRVQVRLAAQEDGVVLSVDDTAPGVPPAHLPHLFERLYRVDASRNRAAGGAGLGLAICRAIVAAHGGTIQAQPSALGGLSVRVTLPLQGELDP